ILLDGQKLGTIANGEIKSFEVPSGMRKLKAKINWVGSREVEFSINPNETKYFRLSAFKYSRILIPMFFIVLAAHLILRRTAGINYIIWLAIPGFLVLIYYLTIGR